MLAVEFTFPAGHYHATPWNRHVNEGAVAWPPEPWRILRGLIATWHHKLKHTGRYDESTLAALIESLASEAPEYRLPAASHSHTRHYMPQFAAGKTSLVFDAFTAVGRHDPLTVTWPNLYLPDEQRALLDDLLNVMGYLGRAESWVEARTIAQAPVSNCVPGEAAVDVDTGELKGELVTMYAPLSAEEYHARRAGFLTDRKTSKTLGASLPAGLLGALSVDTSELRKQGWSQPPAAHKVSYVRPVAALRPVRSVHVRQPRRATSIGFILGGKPLPRVEDSLRIGELMRVAVMVQFKRMSGADGVPAIFSGHGLPAGNRHRHVFYLPWDGNADGRIDRLLVHAPDGIDPEQQRVVCLATRLWNVDGNEWTLTLESVGGDLVARPLMQRACVWESITPYLHPWYVKKRCSIEDQIHRECRERGLPNPVGLDAIDEIGIGKDRAVRSIRFHRFRRHRGLRQPDRLGSFWRLTFAEPVAGPLALGFACHYGLGLFKRVA